MNLRLRAPFPYYGGKSTVAADVWDALGDPTYYVEPFFGSGAVLLARPPQRTGTPRRYEILNDLDGHVVNFWRSLATDPDAVADATFWPIHELDLHARGDWLFERKADLAEQLRGDPEFCDPKLAGWWAWVMSTSISTKAADRRVNRARPNLNHLQGVNVAAVTRETLLALSARLAGVATLCGDWRRPLTNGAVGENTRRSPDIGVFLDPPYAEDERRTGLYQTETPGVAADVLEWCKENGDRGTWRIMLAGFDSEHAELETLGWRVQAWESGHPTKNRTRERLWFSPHCLQPAQNTLF